MKENNVTIDDWDWCIDDESRLVPWFRIFREVEEKFTVKSDDTTCIFKVKDSSQRSYLVKHFSPNSIKEHLIAFFSSKAQNIYDSSQLLHRCGIPCAEYPGWAKNGTESMVLSVEIPDTVTALEYWFRTVTHNSALRREFVSNLAKLVTSCAAASLSLPKLSLEHILVENNGSAMYIVNPHDVDRMEGGLSAAARVRLLSPFLELRGEVSPENISIALLEAGFCDNSMDVTEIIHEEIDKIEEEIEDGSWPDFAEHVLNGESGPLCRVIQNGDDILRVRNTIWYSEMPVPDDSNSIAETIGEDDAERIWIDSFKAQLLRHHCPRIPLSWEQKADGHNIIRYASTYDDILACGFNQ